MGAGGQAGEAQDEHVRHSLPAVETEAIRLSVAGYFQPQLKGPVQDGVVRVAELELLLPGGRAVPMNGYFAAEKKSGPAGR